MNTLRTKEHSCKRLQCILFINSFPTEEFLHHERVFVENETRMLINHFHFGSVQLYS